MTDLDTAIAELGDWLRIPFDAGMLDAATPALTVGTRGMVPEDRLHAPDESHRIASLELGLKAARALYEELASLA